MDEKLRNKNNNKISKIFSKILISLIIVFSSLIFTSISENNKNLFKKYVFEKTFNFIEFKSLYNKLSGTKINNEQLVFSDVIEYESKEKYLDGEKYLVKENTPVKSLVGGVVVFTGEKENYNKCIIIQGNNGYDFLYGNLDNIDVNLYDYISNEKIIGSSLNEFYLVISKDDKYYTYEEYKDKI